MARSRKHRLWTDDEKRSICLQTRAPGVSVAQVARRYAMNANLIFKWLKDPRYVPKGAVGDVPVFLPVEISPENSFAAPMNNDVPVAACVGHCGRLEIILPDGIRLKVEGGFDGEGLARLVKGLIA
jgi:transposase